MRFAQVEISLFQSFASRVLCAALPRAVQRLCFVSETGFGVLFLDQSTMKAAGRKELEKGKWVFRVVPPISTRASSTFPALVSRITF